MMETVLDFEEFKRKISQHYDIRYTFRIHRAGTATLSIGETCIHLHLDMAAPSASLHFYSGKPTHIVRFKYREEAVSGSYDSLAEREVLFHGYCQRTFIGPLDAKPGEWA